MAEVAAKRYQDQLKTIRKNVETSYQYFKANCDRFHEFRRFVFQSTMNSDDISLLKELQKPVIEFNILEAYISRLRGEFSKQEPSIVVRAADGAQNVDPKVIEVVEGHLRAILSDANNDNLEYKVYTDLLSGGFSVIRVGTEYAHEMSFHQNLTVGRVFDPTLCGFDPLAKRCDKGDGRWCFELYPKTKDEAEEMGIDTSKIRFSRNVDGFSWSYNNELEDILLICDYYVKKKKKVKIIQRVDGKVMLESEYNKFVQYWNDQGHIAQAPGIIGKPRTTEIVTICRYRLIEDKVLDYIETDYKYFPLKYIDGNSIDIRMGDSGASYQHTRPYVYNAKGIQKLKNFAGQTLANELENMVMHKFMVSKDSIPPEYKTAYENVQKANVLVYEQYKNNDPNIPLNPPREIQRIPAPPEVTNTFTLSDQITQAILGNFDQDLGKIPTNAMSGIAIQETATLSNAASMPYIVGYMQGLTQVAVMIVDLIPKYWTTPRTIPILRSDGKRSYQVINTPGHKDNVDLNYGENVLEVSVTSGVNFAIQKSRALQQIIALMQASQLFAQFMNTEGLPLLLDNIEIRGIEQLKQAAEQWMKQQKQIQQQQMQQQANMPNPEMMKMQALQQKNQIDQVKLQLDQQKLAIDQAKLQQEGLKTAGQLHIDQQQVQNDKMRIAADIREAELDSMADQQKAKAEELRSVADLHMSALDLGHQHKMDHAKHGLEVHKHIVEINKPEKENHENG